MFGGGGGGLRRLGAKLLLASAGCFMSGCGSRSELGEIPWLDLPEAPVPSTPGQVHVGCDAPAEGISLLSLEGDVYLFSPQTQAVRQVGKVACPVSELASMALARDGSMWLGTVSGALFRANADGSDCTLTHFDPRVVGRSRFGTGIVADLQGRDLLFVAPIITHVKGQEYAEYVPYLVVAPLSNVRETWRLEFPRKSAAVEFAGTGNARLFGLDQVFDPPAPNRTMLFELAPRDGTSFTEHDISGVGELSNFDFAFWNGAIYVFNSGLIPDGPGNWVTAPKNGAWMFRYELSTRQLSRLGTLPFVVIGAGSTTCAPL
jgi:hypothetical protein